MDTENIEEVEAENSREAEREANEENVFRMTPTSAGTDDSKERPEVKVLSFAMKKYCFVRHNSLNDIEDECERDVVSSFTGQVSQVLAGSPYSTLSAHDRSYSAHSVFAESGVENAMRVRGSLSASGLHEHIVCSDLFFIIEKEIFVPQRTRYMMWTEN